MRVQSSWDTRTWVNGPPLDHLNTQLDTLHVGVRLEILMIFPKALVSEVVVKLWEPLWTNCLDGSSSGSAVAVSANIVPLSIGTETDTSVIGPASINGIVGIKPTVGLTSRSGVIPISETMDTVGTFGRTVADAVHGLNAIIGADEADTATCSPFRPPDLDYSKYRVLQKDLYGAKFGLPGKKCWDLVPEDQKAIAVKVFEAIKEAGGEVVGTEFPCAEDHIPDSGWDWSVSGAISIG